MDTDAGADRSGGNSSSSSASSSSSSSPPSPVDHQQRGVAFFFFLPDGRLPLDPPELRVLIPAALGLVCLLGLAGIVTATGVLISNARQQAKLSLINALILNLLLADALLLTLVAPLKAAAFSDPVGSWSLGWFACKTLDWSAQTCLVTKSATLVVMANACHRYAANPSRNVNVRLAAIALLLPLLWACGGALALPVALFSELSRGEEGVAKGSSVCVRQVPVESRGAVAAYAPVYPLLAYALPLGLALLFSLSAHRHSRRRGNSKTQNLRTQLRSRKLSLMLLGLLVSTATLWLPQWLCWWWGLPGNGGGRGGGGGRGLWLAAELLPLLAALLDPLLVLALGEEFRHGYKLLWRRLTLRPPPSTSGKAKPTHPHTPTAPTSPRTRPETSLPPAGESLTDTDMDADTLTDTHTHKDRRKSAQANTHSSTTPPPGSNPNPNPNPSGTPPADGVLPDVEQFWHGRENAAHTDNNDPIPWEHQEPVE